MHFYSPHTCHKTTAWHRCTLHPFKAHNTDLNYPATCKYNVLNEAKEKRKVKSYRVFINWTLRISNLEQGTRCLVLHDVMCPLSLALYKACVSILTNKIVRNMLNYQLGYSKLLYNGTSVHERLSSRTNRFTNEVSEQNTSRVTSGVSSNEHASRKQRLATSWEYRRESVSCCVIFAQYTQFRFTNISGDERPPGTN
jgi:hypothetical protein